MARSLPPYTWKNGFAEPTEMATWANDAHYVTEDGEKSHYVRPPAEELVSSTVHNGLGRNVIRTWPTLYNGTESPHCPPISWKPSNEVDVLICGGKHSYIPGMLWSLTSLLAGPFGLEVALSLARQGLNFRIIGNPLCGILFISGTERQLDLVADAS